MTLWGVRRSGGRSHSRARHLRSVPLAERDRVIAGIRIVKHETVANSGSFEVRFSDGRESVYFYFDDEASGRLRPELLTRKEALENAKNFARAERDKDNIKG
jgi:hypothetical protein